MWIVLPTKDCKCATCEKLRDTVLEDGTLRMGASGTSFTPTCYDCGTLMVLHFWDRPGGPPGNGFRCPKCGPTYPKTPQ